ncbi:hypothetical protein B0J15DRAFT_264492 [Fusarium solani]|uniref:Uncharacterized protein n=1 Tax=Fusarium solani TaxID=169388 RepID=A0A9P9HUR4_FUSSL|nr:uncharacterized protein B0J15DRAFT_264492 [Fusarium solani]KAH7264154.1 hypothetical protein B0J15DRAFT_264492 [Fusarium solani]
MDARRYFAPCTSSLCVSFVMVPLFSLFRTLEKIQVVSIDKKREARNERLMPSFVASVGVCEVGWLGPRNRWERTGLSVDGCSLCCVVLACSSLFPCARALTRWSCAAAVLFLNPSFGVGFLAFNNGFPVSTMAWRQSNNNKRSAGWFVVKVVVSRLAKVVSICEDEIRK